jgi:acyl-coenzyme A synthetase/AMP-(fatty) acid ligase/acyl carrier protein
VRTSNLAGEPLDTALVDRIYEQSSVTKVYDLYGPTEATVYATCAFRSMNRPATIGRPISHTRVYLLDEYLQPVPVGLPGELYIGGDGLARGYLNRPELTKEKFIPSPFPQETGRLYKTGDLARYRPDGNIEFLGRKDYQVKVRGFRIELREIETVLRQHPSVEGVAVIASKDAQGEQRLVAYSHLTPDDEANPADLRAWLQTKLPDYMVPSIFVALPALPLTPNGKVDRKALPAPEAVQSSKEDFVAPSTSAQRVLADIWSEVLGLEKIGVHDNFFELGGHSLKSIQVISRLQEEIQVELSMGDFFEEPTLGGLAQRIEAILAREIDEMSEEKAQSLAQSVTPADRS